MNHVSRSPRKASSYAPPLAFSGLLVALLLLGTLNSVEGEQAKLLGRVAIAALLGVAGSLSVVQLARGRRFPKPLRSVVLVFAGFLLLHLPLFSGRCYGPRGWIVTIQLALVFSFFLVMSLWTWDNRSLKVLSLMASLSIIPNVMWWIWSEMPYPYQSYFSNPNAFGSFVLLMIFFGQAHSALARPGANGRLVNLVSLLALPLLFASAARSAWLAGLAMLATYTLWKTITHTRGFFRLWLPCCLIFMAATMYLYINYSDLLVSDGYNEMTLDYTGKRLNSGRQRLWPVLIDAVRDKPLYGYGPGISVSGMLRVDLSAHNLYLQIGLQVGLVGLALLLLLMCKIWSILWLGRKNRMVRMCGAFYVGILVHQIFNVSLTQNDLVTGMLAWLMLAIGVSVSLQEQDQPTSATSTRRPATRLAMPRRRAIADLGSVAGAGPLGPVPRHPARASRYARNSAIPGEGPPTDNAACQRTTNPKDC